MKQKRKKIRKRNTGKFIFIIIALILLIGVLKVKSVINDPLKISNEEVIVIYDDISLEVGRLRIREKGSHGGHNGIKSIIANLGTDVFPRIKVGVGAPKGNLVSHVLGKFSEDEIEVLRETIKASSDAVSIMMKADTKEAMNKLNGFNACKES